LTLFIPINMACNGRKPSMRLKLKELSLIKIIIGTFLFWKIKSLKNSKLKRQSKITWKILICRLFHLTKLLRKAQISSLLLKKIHGQKILKISTIFKTIKDSSYSLQQLAQLKHFSLIVMKKVIMLVRIWLRRKFFDKIEEWHL
jgi:hypothetical protein